jgi:hypothetical protein
MEIIQGFLGFVKSEASEKNGVNPTTIKSITKDNILMGLVTYSMAVNTRKIGIESLILEIYNDISIPKVIETDQKKGFIG